MSERSKNDEEIEIQDGEEIIEEVIEEQVEWIGPEEVMEQEQSGYYNAEDILDHEQLVEYGDPESYQSFLPLRHGIPVLSLNLPDLLSKVCTFSDTERMVLCFNKKCQRQVAFAGFLYTIKDYVSETQWNNWRCVNPHCFGEIRTTPDYRELRVCHDHGAMCAPDELQIRIRVAVYDLRLMAEFTEAPLETLYAGAQSRLKSDIPEASDLFPSFEVMKPTLEDHRINKIYRKRFEMQNLKDKQKKLHMTPDEVVFNENASGLIKFRRTKPFPTSICVECNDQLMSNNLPSQDHLVAHYMFNHDRRMTIERFEFKDVNQFDQYLRELNTFSRYKFKRMGLADENMYYLCSHDDRLAKTGIGRASRMQEQNNHCTAFIRVFDWRIVSKREGSRILIDYCLEHQPHHDVNVLSNKEEIDYYSPEVFVRDMEERRARTQKLMNDDGSHRIKRPLEVRTYVPAGRAKPSFGTRALAPPLAAQIAAGTANPYVDAFEEQNSINSRPRVKFRQSIRTAYPKNEEEQPSTSNSSDLNTPPARVYVNQKPYTRLTERQNFKDIYTFNAVCKLEDTVMSLLSRMQNCQSARVGIAYRDKLNSILKNAISDPALADDASASDAERSWTLQKAMRGRPKKRMRLEFEDDSVGEEEEDEEEEEKERANEEEEEGGKDDETMGKEGADGQSSSNDAVKKVEVKSEKLEKKEESGALRLDKSETTRSGRQRKVPARLVQ